MPKLCWSIPPAPDPGALDPSSRADCVQWGQLRGIILFWVVCNYVSVGVLMVCMPLFAFVPGGWRDESGYLNFISNGFLKHSALSSLVYGVATACILVVRLLAVLVYVSGDGGTGESSDATCACATGLVDPQARQQGYSMLLLVTFAAGLVTARYDEVQSVAHWAAAAVCIASSLAFYALVVVFNGKYAEENGAMAAKAVWGVSQGAALACMSMLVVYVADPSPGVWLSAGVAEYVSVEGILVLDAMLGFSIHRRLC